MKKYYFLILLLCATVSIQLQAQVFRGELIGGANLSQVEGDEIYGFRKFGLHVGAGVEMPFNDQFSLTMELLFSQKGAYQKQQYLADSSIVSPDQPKQYTNGAYNLTLDYLEVPVMFMYTEKNVFKAAVGFSYGRRVGVKEVEHDIYNTSSVADTAYSLHDYNVLGELRFRCYKDFWFGLRYAYSLASIRTRTFYAPSTGGYNTRDQFNNLITFRLIWVINGNSKSIRKVIDESE